MDINFTITLIGCILSGIGSAFAYRQISQNRNRSWRQSVAAVDKIGRWAKKKNYDIIVSFSDGGLIVADLLSIRHFPGTPVVSLPMTLEQKKFNSVASVMIGYSVTLPSVEKILLVDDVIQSGKSLEAAEIFLIKSFEIEEDCVDTAVIAKLKGVEGLNVDFASFEYRSIVKLPWGTTPRTEDEII